MLKLHRLIFILALFLIPLFLSSCYTIIGYPPNVEDATVKKDTEHKGIYREYYYYDSPYFWGGLDDYSYYLYHGYPSYYNDYYWNRPWWLYNDGYYWDDNNNYYAPEKKPEIRKRDATELRNNPREEQKDNKERAVQPKDKQDFSDDDQKSQRKYRSGNSR